MLKKGNTSARIISATSEVHLQPMPMGLEIWLTVRNNDVDGFTAVLIDAADLLGAIDHLKRLAFEREVDEKHDIFLDKMADDDDEYASNWGEGELPR